MKQIKPYKREQYLNISHTFFNSFFLKKLLVITKIDGQWINHNIQ